MQRTRGFQRAPWRTRRALCSSLAGAAAQLLLGQCEFDVCGYWYSENYFCFGTEPPAEYFSVDQVGDELVCTKVLGDQCVPTGAVTWHGIPSSCAFPSALTVSNGIGGSLSSIPGQVVIVSSQEIYITGIFGTLYFYPSNTGHFDAIGVDYAPFPVSCVNCTTDFATVFTPNGDGLNDLLEPLCGRRSALFSVRNRWGEVVYETTDPLPSWDGRMRWDPCPAGVYFWSMLTLDDRFGTVRHGTVQLLR